MLDNLGVMELLVCKNKFSLFNNIKSESQNTVYNNYKKMTIFSFSCNFFDEITSNLYF